MKKSTIKNIYAEKFKKHSTPLLPQFMPTIPGYTVANGFILENGTDIVDGEEKAYLILKLYMKESKDELA